ncbi:hypothetical protein FNL55_15045 [Tardiphaga sp. vice352]|uniref:hypothetical protein n=1 Tax=unclassified Tardiphaga TaxID=2631404 RepID=UPI0011625700|nr:MULTISPECIES: hypothetical protein [unclassified Tardiphaga]QDM17160.1 hypothetical protein FNL53_15325 [Tardiphaga sp. vice278]QDM27396.1 hypothetical protein FNL56_15645 [Tardiphaga sp. vice304]QDM32522.1 hypothetical protein FNL55_15045 [Tardiphaga sp. vice352]
MKKRIVTLVCLMLFCGSLAHAQDSTRNAPPASVKRAQQGVQPRPGLDAPVGHRQPRAGDVPETGSNDPGKIDAQDRELDRMIKGICKGC